MKNSIPPSSAEVKERVELYLYSPFRSLWHIPGWTLPLPEYTRQWLVQMVMVKNPGWGGYHVWRASCTSEPAWTFGRRKTKILIPAKYRNKIPRAIQSSAYLERIASLQCYYRYWCVQGARGGADGSGTALQVGRSWVRFPMVSLDFFSSGRSMVLGLTQPLTEMFPGSKGGRCVRLTTLPPLCADCLEIWEPQTPGTLRACPGL